MLVLSLAGGLASFWSTALGFFLVNLLFANLVLVGFNLLPAFPMDGGRVLRALLSGFIGRARATIAAAGIGRILAVLFGLLSIFVTHNPNIPVLGDADRVFIMNSDGQHSTLERAGSVDELKDRIETLLEGGREAFLLRKERYGH